MTSRRRKNKHTAIDLDELLAAITPEMAGELARHIPAGWADQLTAATDKSTAAMEAAEGASVRHIPTECAGCGAPLQPHNPPGYARSAS